MNFQCYVFVTCERVTQSDANRSDTIEATRMTRIEARSNARLFGPPNICMHILDGEQGTKLRDKPHPWSKFERRETVFLHRA
jgi:hypothetical protein